jgi:hypothetical protein
MAIRRGCITVWRLMPKLRDDFSSYIQNFVESRDVPYPSGTPAGNRNEVREGTSLRAEPTLPGHRE